jgi:hypothetical protein
VTLTTVDLTTSLRAAINRVSIPLVDRRPLSVNA